MRLSHAGTFVGGVALAIALMVLLGAGGAVKSPTGTAPDRYIYYPGTEALKSDEICFGGCCFRSVSGSRCGC